MDHAGSLLATRLLLPAPASHPPTAVVALGAGAQIAAHLALFLASYPSLATCTVLNRSRNPRLEALAAKLRAEFPKVAIDGLAFHYAGGEAGEEETEGERRLRDADIVITATSSARPLFPSRWVKKGAHLCLIGSYTPDM